MKIARIQVLLLGLFLLGGCATGSKLVAPRLTLVNASLVSADVFAQQFRVRLRVENPNARELPIKGIDYKLFLEGDGFAEGKTEAGFTVPANGDKEFDLTMQTNFVSSIGRLLSRLNGASGNTVRYTLVGNVIVDTMFSPKLAFTESGTVDLGRR